jgi:hypothetical protein
MRISQNLALGAVAAAIILAPPADAAGRRDQCRAAIEEEVTRLPVDPANVGEISIQVNKNTSREGNTRIQRVLGWVDLLDCTGKLVIEVSPRCRFKQAYTTDECAVSGLSNY